MGGIKLFLRRLFCFHHYKHWEVWKYYINERLINVFDHYYCTKCGKSKIKRRKIWKKSK